MIQLTPEEILKYSLISASAALQTPTDLPAFLRLSDKAREAFMLSGQAVAAEAVRLTKIKHLSMIMNEIIIYQKIDKPIDKETLMELYRRIYQFSDTAGNIKEYNNDSINWKCPLQLFIGR